MKTYTLKAYPGNRMPTHVVVDPLFGNGYVRATKIGEAVLGGASFRKCNPREIIVVGGVCILEEYETKPKKTEKTKEGDSDCPIYQPDYVDDSGCPIFEENDEDDGGCPIFEEDDEDDGGCPIFE